MKNILSTLLLTFFAFSAFSQANLIKLSDKITSETKYHTSFEKLDVADDFKVIVEFSDREESVVIEANENLHDYITVEQEGAFLKIRTKSYSTKRNGADEKLIAHITMKRLTELKGNEDVSYVFKNKFTSDQLMVKLNDDSSLKGSVEIGSLIVNLDDDSKVEFEGSAEAMEVKAKDDSMIKSYDFIVGDLTMNLSDDSEAKLTVNGDIKLRASDDSYFSYQGSGTFSEKHLSGDSEVKSK